MKNTPISTLLILLLFFGCGKNTAEEDAPHTATALASEQASPKTIEEGLPTIGLLMYDSVLMTEVTAPMDVFGKLTADGRRLFNVITIAETADPVLTEEGLRIIPDYTFENCPELTVLFVPSAYDMWTQVHNEKIVEFVRMKNQETKYTVSNCAGAQLIGAAGIADGHKIVTWIGGGEQLQKDYPELLVQDDSQVSFVADGKFLSSNGNLATYISSLELLEVMTGPEHREFVKSYLYLDRLQAWREQ